MESASGVNQDFGVTTVERTVVLDVQSIVRSPTEFVRHALPAIGENRVKRYVTTHEFVKHVIMTTMYLI